MKELYTQGIIMILIWALISQVEIEIKNHCSHLKMTIESLHHWSIKKGNWFKLVK